jgi:hypothetical protein
MPRYFIAFIGRASAFTTAQGYTLKCCCSVSQSNQLKIEEIAKLCQIKVVRTAAFPTGVPKSRKPKITRLGNHTWLVGVRELAKPPSPDEQLSVGRALKTLRSKIKNPGSEINWIRWSNKTRFAAECREGDSLIQIWHSRDAKRPSVFRTTPVLMKQKAEKWTRFYFREPTDLQAEMAWGRFKRLLKELGHTRNVGPWSVQRVDDDLAEAIARKWKFVARS